MRAKRSKQKVKSQGEESIWERRSKDSTLWQSDDRFDRFQKNLNNRRAVLQFKWNEWTEWIGSDSHWWCACRFRSLSNLVIWCQQISKKWLHGGNCVFEGNAWIVAKSVPVLERNCAIFHKITKMKKKLLQVDFSLLKILWKKVSVDFQNTKKTPLNRILFYHFRNKKHRFRFRDERSGCRFRLH